MRDSGLQMVFLGAESGSDETLQAHEQGRHGVDRQDAGDRRRRWRATASCRSSRSCWAIRPIRRPTRAQTIEFIRKVKRVNPRTEIILYMYTPVPLAGELYDEAKARGVRVSRRRSRSGSARTGRSSRSAAAPHMPWLARSAAPADPRLRARAERLLPDHHRPAADGRLALASLRAASAWRYHLRLYATRSSCGRCSGCWPTSGRRRAGSEIATRTALATVDRACRT